MASEDEWRRPWIQRRTTQVTADTSDTLAVVLERAAEQLDVQPPADHHTKRYSGRSARIAFWRPEHDERGITADRSAMHELNVIDHEGRLRFGVYDLRTITVEQVLRSAQAGVIDGDPLRPYLVVEVGYGDAPPIDWPTFKAALDVAYDVVQVVASVGGAAAVLKLSLDSLKRRIKRGQESLDLNWTEWSQRSQRPDQFASLLRLRPWTREQLAALLGCREQDADGILWAFGFEADEDGRWRPSPDPAAVATGVIYTQANYAAHRHYDEWETTFRARLTEYFTSGEDPGYHNDDFDDEDDVVYGVGRVRFEAVGKKLFWVRAFCRSARLVTREALQAAVDDSGVELRSDDAGLIVRLPSGSDALLSLDAPSLTEDALSNRERDEFVDALLLKDEGERIEVLRRILDAKITFALGLPESLHDADRTAATQFIAGLAELFDGMLQVDGAGFFYDGGLRLELTSNGD